MMEKYEQAEKDYILGHKYKEISDKYDVSVNTVKSWKKRHNWVRGAPKKKKVHPKNKKVAPSAPKVAPKIIEEIVSDKELSEKQKLFCFYYPQRFNATWAYQKVYGSSYETALSNGPKLLRNARIREYIAKIKEENAIKLQMELSDISLQYAQQAKADIRDVQEFETVKHLSWLKVRDDNGPYEDSSGKFRYDPKIDPETGEQEFYFKNEVKLKNSNEIDTSNIKSIRIDKGEAVVEMYDKQKALDALSKLLDTDNMAGSGVQINITPFKGADEDANNA